MTPIPSMITAVSGRFFYILYSFFILRQIPPDVPSESCGIYAFALIPCAFRVMECIYPLITIFLEFMQSFSGSTYTFVYSNYPSQTFDLNFRHKINCFFIPVSTCFFCIRNLTDTLFIFPVLRMQQHMCLVGHRFSEEIAVDFLDIRVFMRIPEF